MDLSLGSDPELSMYSDVRDADEEVILLLLFSKSRETRERKQKKKKKGETK